MALSVAHGVQVIDFAVAYATKKIKIFGAHWGSSPFVMIETNELVEVNRCLT